MKLIRPYGFRRAKTFKKFGHLFLCDHNIMHERERSIQKRDQFVFTFSENIRELTIKFFRLLIFFSTLEYLGYLFSDCYVPVKISRISLNISYQVVHVTIMLLPDISFDFSLHKEDSKLDLSFALPDFLAFA